MRRILTLIFILLFSNNIFSADSSDIKPKLPKQVKLGLNLVDFSDIVPELLPTVVNVSTTKKVVSNNSSDIEDLLKALPKGSIVGDLKGLLEKQKKHPESHSYSSGSGFIISDDGYIVTNNHVIDGSDEISISFQDGEKIKAKLVGSDEKTDIALLKINIKKKLKFAKFGNSDKSKIGQWVIAVGNPFGLGGSVSSGIISARGRDINTGQINDFIQTDAAINKGNSGGPLFNIFGEVIGIATAIYSPSGGNIGIGFATPSNIVKDIIRDLKINGKIERGYLGVSVQEVTTEIAESINMKDIYGAMVVKVFENSPANKAGILSSDIITRFDGKKINKMRELPIIVAKAKIGKKVKIEIIRKGKKRNLKVRIGELDQKDQKQQKSKSDSKILGMDLKKIDENIRKEYKLHKNVDGLLVTAIDNNSIAKSKFIMVGDILISANQVKLKSTKILQNIINKLKENKRNGVFLIIKRGDDNFAVVLPFK